MNYAARNRLETNKRPTYRCGRKPTTGNKKLDYVVGLMTSDEEAFAGGKYVTNALNTYYYLNSIGTSVTGSTYWWTMLPYNFHGSGSANVFRMGGSTLLGTSTTTTSTLRTRSVQY